MPSLLLFSPPLLFAFFFLTAFVNYYNRIKYLTIDAHQLMPAFK